MNLSTSTHFEGVQIFMTLAKFDASYGRLSKLGPPECRANERPLDHSAPLNITNVETVSFLPTHLTSLLKHTSQKLNFHKDNI